MNPDRTARDRRQLSQAEPSRAGAIADATVIKDGALYFLCGAGGAVPLASGSHGLGLFYRDCRFISGYELRIHGARPESLSARAEQGFRAEFLLTNPRIEAADVPLSTRRLGISWQHVLDSEHCVMIDRLVFENYGSTAFTLPCELTVEADFRDVFVIRGLHDARPGRVQGPVWDGNELCFAYHGADGHVRRLCAMLSEPPAWTKGARFGFELVLEPHAPRTLNIQFSVLEAPASDAQALAIHAVRRDVDLTEHAQERSIAHWMSGFSGVSSSCERVQNAMQSSLRDLRTLQMNIEGHRFFAAGVPWFTTLFGRDSLLSALQTLAYRADIAADTLRLLAHFQGKRVDPRRDEEPGKILHELRTGELARIGEIPHTPYYGTVDATPLFVILLYEHSRWVGDLALFHELRDSLEQALAWMAEWGDHDGDGYLDYRAQEEDNRLVNQGWKDSGDAIMDARARAATPPIALVGLQGYAFRAQRAAVRLFDHAGEHERAQELDAAARALAARFERDFWLEERGCYALALQRGRKPVDVVSSNPGHALWAGIVPHGRASTLVRRLFAPDMYSGWGIRTLSAQERAYNPLGYHLGTVWPHDNSIIAAGMRDYGFSDEALRIFTDLLEAAARLGENYRLPEVFAGYARHERGSPVRYPIACHPQAWAAGAIPFLLQSLLGLEPDGLRRRLRIVRPCLPAFVPDLRLDRVRVGEAEVDLLFEHSRQGPLTVQVLRKHGQLEVELVRE